MDNNDQIYSSYESDVEPERSVLTLDNLKNMEPGMVFASGTVLEPILWKEPVRWIAKRGHIYDWAIYYHLESHTEEWIENFGDKCTTEKVIRDLVPCDDSAFSMYRF